MTTPIEALKQLLEYECLACCTKDMCKTCEPNRIANEALQNQELIAIDKEGKRIKFPTKDNSYSVVQQKTFTLDDVREIIFKTCDGLLSLYSPEFCQGDCVKNGEIGDCRECLLSEFEKGK